MDRLVTVDIKEIELTFNPSQKCSKTFKVTNLMHTMSVAISLTTTNPSLFSFNQAFSLLQPLSTSSFTLFLTQPSESPTLSSPPDSLLVRTTILPTGKALQEDLRRLFSIPGYHIFKDAKIPISFVGHHVVEFLLNNNTPSVKTLESTFLLSKAVSVCSQSQVDSLLWSAVQSGNGNPSFVSALIDAGGDLNGRDSNGRSVMHLPVNSGSIDVVRVLIESGCVIDDSRDWFLHGAASKNRVDLMKVLCSAAGNSVGCVDSGGQTPVHVAAFHGHLDVLKFCVDMGGDIDCADVNGWTPLHCAASEGHIEAVEYLLECSCYSKYGINKDGKTPFLLAIDNGHAHLMDLLRLEDVLHRAARLNDVHGMKNCFTQGAKLNCRDQNGWTPLHRAAFKGHTESVKLLLTQGAQVDLVDDAGYTPLQCAVEAGHMQIALLLIAHGAHASAKSLKGVCPLKSIKNNHALVFPICGENIESPELELSYECPV